MDRIDEIFAAEAAKPDEEIDLARAALLIAKCEYPSLDVELYIDRIRGIASSIEDRLPQSTRNVMLVLELINRHLFDELSFRGNAENYYDPKNSFLNEVIERRTGIPITLSVLYIETARFLGLNVEGVGMPGHFICKTKSDGKEIYLDPFNRGRLLDEADCEMMIAGIYGNSGSFQPSFLQATTKRQILTRMLGNLKNIYLSGGDNARALATVNRILTLNPDSLSELRDRGLINYYLKKYTEAMKDLEKYLDESPEAADSKNVKQYLSRIKSQIAMMN